jgi:ribosomal protein S18 acetylase RimI-like enzyme
MEIKKVKDNKKQYMNLLLEADPDENIVNKYINKSDMYIIVENEKAVCEIVITEVNQDECELKNIATLKEHRGKGYAQKLIEYVFNEYKEKYKRMIVGTTENMIPFYVLNGFTKYHHTVKNFFVDNYDKEIWDGDLHCIDMYYYSKEFKKLDYSIIKISAIKTDYIFATIAIWCQRKSSQTKKSRKSVLRNGIGMTLQN